MAAATAWIYNYNKITRLVYLVFIYIVGRKPTLRGARLQRVLF